MLGGGWGRDRCTIYIKKHWWLDQGHWLEMGCYSNKTKTTGLDLGVVVESEEGDKRGSNFSVLGSKEEMMEHREQSI